VAGILVETRWRQGAPEWTAIGVGVNLRAPDEVAGAAGIGAAVDRTDALFRIVAAVRQAAAAEGALTRDEVQEYMRHDALRGRRVSAPLEGVVVGISEDGELVISNDDGIQTARSGSVILEDDG
jgi:biotin-(acetyl-CoA carboxylase) ligase